MFIGDSKIINDDFFGLYTSLKNNINLEEAKCSVCGHLHNDNDIFVIKPHQEHLCYYCGTLFTVEKDNIGNELLHYLKIAKVMDFPEEKENTKINMIY